MRTAKLIAMCWLTTAGAVAQALGESTYKTTILLALTLQEPVKPRRKAEPQAPYEPTWVERQFGVRKQERD